MTQTLVRKRRRWRRLILVPSLLGTILACLERCFLRCEVEGNSMIPALQEGDRVLFRRRLPLEIPRPGTVIAFDDPRTGEHRLMIKRIDTIEGANAWVLGDHATDSTDSRVFGAIPVSTLTWVFLRRYGHSSLEVLPSSQGANDL